MSLFLTGGTGYLGSYALDNLLRDTDERLALLVRASSREQAIEKLWKAWQLHMDAPRFAEELSRVEFVYGDLHQPDLGIDPTQRERLVNEVDSVVHIAASLNRKSSKACFNTNLRGTLSVIKLAREIADKKGLRRFSHVSTVAICGKRQDEVVTEDNIVDWNKSDYDPYARTKKFCEHMVRELLPDVQQTFFRPSIVMGDSRRPETSQFDMVQAFCLIADLPVVPLKADLRQDIVNADYVGRAIATVHMKDGVKYDAYNLSAGATSKTTQDIAVAMVAAGTRRPARFVGHLQGSFHSTMRVMNRLPRKSQAAQIGALMKVFLPYVTFNTVFDNRRIVEEMGSAPTPFTDYCADLYNWSKASKFKYPHVPLPAGIV